MIPYISYSQMANDIRNNFGRIPRADLVLSVPRSGIVPAGIITKYLNVNMISIHKFCDIAESSENVQESLHNELVKSDFSVVFSKAYIKNVLIVDDTIYSGRQYRKWKERLQQDFYKDFNFIFLTIYKEHINSADISLVDLFPLTKSGDIKSVLYEWTIWNRRDLMSVIAFDIDGVLCVDPPDDANVEEYEKYIRNPIPLYTPITFENPSSAISYRINKYNKETKDFLVRRGFTGKMYLTPFDSREERNSTVTPWDYKVNVLNQLPQIKLYVESNDYEAQLIHNMWGKPVFCPTSNIMYN